MNIIFFASLKKHKKLELNVLQATKSSKNMNLIFESFKKLKRHGFHFLSLKNLKKMNVIFCKLRKAQNTWFYFLQAKNAQKHEFNFFFCKLQKSQKS